MIDVTFSSQVVFQGKFETSLLKSNLYTNFVMNNDVISCWLHWTSKEEIHVDITDVKLVFAATALASENGLRSEANG